jgi:hypothetical protein
MTGKYLKVQIRSEMQLKTTEELSDIWIKNNRAEWTDDAFDVVRELLTERLGNLPKQDKPNYERVDLQAQDFHNFIRSTNFLTAWLGLCFFIVSLVGLFFLQLFFGEDVPFIYINTLLVLTLPIFITSGVFMISRREVARPGATSIKGWVAVIQGVFIVTIVVLIEIVLLLYLFKNIFGF